MSIVLRFSFCMLALSFSACVVGCGDDSPRVVEETDEFSFDEMAAQAAADTALSGEEQ
jgi:hypothetical protein